MKITASRKSILEIDEEALIAPVFAGERSREALLAALNDQTAGLIGSVFESGEIDGEPDRSVYIHHAGQLKARRVLVYGLGEASRASSLSLQRFAGTAIKTLAASGVSSVAMLLPAELEIESSARAIVEGALMGEVNGDYYRAKPESARAITRLSLIAKPEQPGDLERGVEIGRVMGEATNFARRLCSEPGNVMTPSELATRAGQMALDEGLRVEVLGEDEMKELGMGALLSVSRGSEEPARLIALSYEPEGVKHKRSGGDLIALIGKGITFDSGGISIKPAEKMDEMKFDMGGGAAIIGAMQVMARLKPNVRVLGLVAASENLPSGRAYKPGDVIRSMSGKTIEVVNTDAEGRLVLADAITYAISRGATHIIDAATLTGACVIALGEVRAAVMGTGQQLIDELIASGEQCGERLWQLPLDREYGDLIRSDIADIKNMGDRTSGAITAAMFLRAFTGSVPWAHLDIAGTAWLDRARPYLCKGATGFGVRLISSFLLGRAAS